MSGGEVTLLTVDEAVTRAVYSVTTDEEAILALINLKTGKIVESVLSRAQACSDYHAEELRSEKRFHQIRGGFFDPRGNGQYICYTAAKVFRGKVGKPLKFLCEAENPTRHRDSFKIQYLTTSPDHQLLVGGVADGGLTDLWATVWDLETGKRLGDRLTHQDGVNHCQFSPDGSLLATASEDATVRIWQREGAGFNLRLVIQNESSVQRVAFSENGQWLVAVMGNRVQLWDLERGAPLGPAVQQLWGGNIEISGLKFLPGGIAILIQRGRGDLAVLSLIPEQIQIGALMPLAELLSSQRNDAKFGLQPLGRGELREVWEDMHAKYPGAFSVSQSELIRWQSVE